MWSKYTICISIKRHFIFFTWIFFLFNFFFRYSYHHNMCSLVESMFHSIALLTLSFKNTYSNIDIDWSVINGFILLSIVSYIVGFYSFTVIRPLTILCLRIASEIPRHSLLIASHGDIAVDALPNGQCPSYTTFRHGSRMQPLNRWVESGRRWDDPAQ